MFLIASSCLRFFSLMYRMIPRKLSAGISKVVPQGWFIVDDTASTSESQTYPPLCPGLSSSPSPPSSFPSLASSTNTGAKPLTSSCIVS